MEEKDNSEFEEYLINPEQMGKDSNCCSCCLCCCCKGEKEISKSYYINKWRKYLSKDNENVSQPFRILTHLWAHKNVIKELENIRLNPNLISEKNIRNDLEFYIPQLCTFLIFGDYEAVEEFLAFLCKACYASFFFAHRVVWFLKSLINSSNMNEKIEYILQLIQTIFKSEKDKLRLERLHIANSKRYIDFFTKYNLQFIYSKNAEDIVKSSLSPIQSEFYNVYKTGSNLIKTFCDKHFEYSNDLEKQKEEFKWSFYLNPEEVFVNLFKNSYRDTDSSIGIGTGSNIAENNNSETTLTTDLNSNPIDPPPLNTSSPTKVPDINLQSFQSSLNFTNLLCAICENMGGVPNDEQMAFLRKEISAINKTLPSNVYIPFLKDSVRNYIICHIPVTEMKIFRTKNRAPYMITVECIRIDEIINSILRKEKSIIRNNRLVGRNLDQEEQVMQDYSVNYNNYNNNNNSNSSYSPPDILKARSLSMVDSSQNAPHENDLYLVKKTNTKSFLNLDDPKAKAFKNNLLKKRSSTIRMLEESDIRLSKPVIISNLEAEIKRTPLRGEKKIILEENEENEESFVKEGIDDIVKRRLTLHPMGSAKKMLPSGFSKNNKEEEEDDEIIKFKSRGRNYTTCEPNRSKTSLIIEELKEDVQCVEQPDSSSDWAGHSINVDFQNVFGELVEDQSARVKQFSPFSLFNTWKMFKLIVKSGEDLRQEQFATQLINEFHQIFQMEKVGCWVNTYEILATGDNVGIIECVPNAISIDQLKKKIKNNSLRTFFENYFGPTDSTRFKKSMNNFISSLAGYSLVCYFLQIKDRHNANILIDNEGHLIHIDFGFLLSNAPGKGLKFESAPFKLTADFVEAMGGVNSTYFTKFRKLLWKGFIALVKHSEKILILVEMMFCGHGKNLPCFEHKEYTIDALKSRFYPKPNMKKHDYMQHVDELIEQSIDNWRTRWYDKFQYWVQGIFY